jgi:hypothetical protein
MMSEPYLGESEVKPIAPAPERYLYRGAEGEFEFDAWNAYHGGRQIERSGQIVESVEVSSFRWAGERSGDELSDEDQDRLAAALAAYYRRRGKPFDIHFLSGEIEDETGRLRPGFRGGLLPDITRSDGWSIVDHWMTPEYEDPGVFPPTIQYRDFDGEAEMIREIEISGGFRQRVLKPATLRWIGRRSGEPMTKADRARIFSRIRSVYDHLGRRYRVHER